MQTYTLHLVAAAKHSGLRDEIEKISSHEGQNVFLQVTGVSSSIKSFSAWVDAEDSGDPDFILILGSIVDDRCNTDLALREMVESIKKAKFSKLSKIVLLLPAGQEQPLLFFVNELIKLEVHDFFFAEAFCMEDIADWLLQPSRTLKDNEKYLRTAPPKEVITKEVIKIERIAGDSKNPPPTAKEKVEGKQTKIHGVLGACPGIGVTCTCLRLAEAYAATGQRVALLDRTEHGHLSHLASPKHFDLVIGKALHGINIAAYDHILIDFGLYAAVDPGGAYIRNKIDPGMEQARRIEMQFCTNIILVASAEPYRLYEAEFYIKDPIMQNVTADWVFFMRGVDQHKEFLGFQRKYQSKRVIIFEDLKSLLTEL